MSIESLFTLISFISPGIIMYLVLEKTLMISLKKELKYLYIIMGDYFINLFILIFLKIKYPLLQNLSQTLSISFLIKYAVFSSVSAICCAIIVGGIYGFICKQKN